MLKVAALPSPEANFTVYPSMSEPVFSAFAAVLQALQLSSPVLNE